MQFSLSNSVWVALLPDVHAELAVVENFELLPDVHAWGHNSAEFAVVDFVESDSAVERYCYCQCCPFF